MKYSRMHNVAIMVGGTGLYIKAFCEGMDEMPGVPAGGPKVNYDEL